jgi:hypothetical protein
MWSKSSVVNAHGYEAKKVWSVLTDFNAWHTWQDDVDVTQLDKTFSVGEKILYKHTEKSKKYFTITEIIPNKSFTLKSDVFTTKMYEKYEVIETESGVDIKITVSVTGLFSGLVGLCVADEIANGSEWKILKLLRRYQQV